MLTVGREGSVGWASQQQSARRGTGRSAVGVLGRPGRDRGRAVLWGTAAGCARHTGVPGARRQCLARRTPLGNAIAATAPAPLGEHSLTPGYPAGEAERALPRGRCLPSGRGGSLIASLSVRQPARGRRILRKARALPGKGWVEWLVSSRFWAVVAAGNPGPCTCAGSDSCV